MKPIDHSETSASEGSDARYQPRSNAYDRQPETAKYPAEKIQPGTPVPAQPQPH